MNAGNLVADDGVAHSIGGNLERSEHRHAVVQQGAQGTGKLGHFVFLDDRLERRHTQEKTVQLASPYGGAGIAGETGHNGPAHQQHRPPIAAHELAHAHHNLRGHGKLGVEVVEDGNEIREHERDQDEDRGEAHDGEEGRVNHGGGGLAAQFLFLLSERHDAPEHLVQHSPRFARAHQVGVEQREGARVPVHGVGQGVALLHVVAQLVDDLCEHGVFCLAHQRAQRLGKQHTRLNQVGQLPEEHVAFLQLDAAQRATELVQVKPRLRALLHRAALVQLDRGGEIPHVAQSGYRRLAVFRLDDAIELFAGAALGFIPKAGHWRSPWNRASRRPPSRAALRPPWWPRSTRAASPTCAGSSCPASAPFP